MSTFIQIRQTHKMTSYQVIAQRSLQKKLAKTHSKTQNPCGTHAFQSSTSKREDHYTFWYQAVSAPTWFTLAQQVFFDSGTSSIINMIGRGSSQSSTPQCPHSSTFNNHKMRSYQVIAQSSLQKKLAKTHSKTQNPCGTHAFQSSTSKREDHYTFWYQAVSAPTWFTLAQQVFFDSGTSSIINMIGRGSSQSSTPQCPHSSTFNNHKMRSYQVIAQSSLQKKLTKTFLKLRTPVVHMHSKAQQANGKNMTFWNWNQSVSAPTWFNLAQQVFFWFRNEQHHQHDRKRELAIINAKMSTFIQIRQTQNDELSSNCATLTENKLTKTLSKTQNTCGTHAWQSSTSKQESHDFLISIIKLCQHQHGSFWLSKCFLIPERAASSTWSEEGALNHQRQMSTFNKHKMTV